MIAQPGRNLRRQFLLNHGFKLLPGDERIGVHADGDIADIADLDRGVEVLRIGNPTKVNDKMLGFTYERRFEAHPDYPQLWAIRKAIRELRSAGKDINLSKHRQRQHQPALDKPSFLCPEVDL